ncbi:uncharacterized protein JCM6883_001720 [Sporobolomyces salmoneus]|uniref:uncharacterized protein n=1 Tax=Sporobolomyces salmoneus TaxID=183962 RepID=UPI00317B2AA2
MSFASSLAQLLTQLRQLPSETPVHLQHLSIRVQRAKLQAEQGQAVEGLELLVRLKGRIEELEGGLDELSTVDRDRGKWIELQNEAGKARRGLEEELKKANETINSALRVAVASNSATTTLDHSHSRSSSTDRTRLVPSSSTTPAQLPETANPTLEAFLSKIESNPVPSHRQQQQLTLSSLAQERARSLSTAYSLFLLATSPKEVLPTGQTISSIFRNSSQTTTQAIRPSPTSQTFYDKVRRKLEENPREGWKMIREELAKKCLPLIPSRLGQGSVKRSIQALLLTVDSTKTEEEEDSTLRAEAEEVVEKGFWTIQTLLETLRRLCAPVRDSQIASVLDTIIKDGTSSVDRFVKVVQKVLELASDMQQDLDRFRSELKPELTSEDDIVEAVREEAREREKKIVRELVSHELGLGSEDVDGAIRKETREWIRRRRGGTEDTNAEGKRKITKEEVAESLVDSLFQDASVSIPPLPPSPTPSPTPSSTTKTISTNALPPIFYSTSPRLFQLQNQLQALTILACLLTILSSFPTPSSSSSSYPVSNTTTTENLVARLWTILNSEIPTFSSSSSSSSSEAAEEETIPTRLAHLSDEIISHLNLNLTESTGKEKKEKVKDSVDRILRYRDPVFKLLRNRLRDGIRAGIIESLRRREERREGEGEGGGNRVPGELRTGRTGQTTSDRKSSIKFLHSSLLDDTTTTTRRIKLEVKVCEIKGYEKLGKEIKETLEEKLEPVWEWMESVWSDVLEWE